MGDLCAKCKNEKGDSKSSYCKNCNRIKNKEWYLKNKENKIERSKRYQKETNYASQKKPESRHRRNVKRKTRSKYPLKDQICQICFREPATEHHHTTTPIEVDQFIFTCHSCHVAQH